MRTIQNKFKDMAAQVPANVKDEVDLSFAIADKLDALMKEKGLSKKELAQAIGKRPSEVTKWLSGQHNFTIRTLSMLSTFFGKSLVVVR
ncbi:MAG: helix-turn-helix transcriptional regulator [Parabacteroides sp.]|nr:helix-turn-helix transcriptional regulator [Parabacteroides sp.]